MPNNAIEAMLKRHGYDVIKDWDNPFDVLLFPGGSDICPMLYGERVVTGTNYDLRRDLLENKAYRTFPKDFPKVGICRGAQLLHVFNGGSLYQDVSGHQQPKGHYIRDSRDGKIILVTSTHHQMMRYLAGGMYIAGAREAITLKTEDASVSYKEDRKKKDPTKDENWSDLEVVFHPETECLCFQPHPEYNIKTCEEYFFQLLEEFTFPSVRAGVSLNEVQTEGNLG